MFTFLLVLQALIAAGLVTVILIREGWSSLQAMRSADPIL